MSNAIYENGRSLDLGRFDDEFRAAALDPDAGTVPDGTYQVVVERVEMGTSQSSGNPKITWTLRILGPSSVNRVLFKTNGVSSNNLHIVKQELHTCGVDPEPFSELPKLLTRMEEVELEVTKKTRNGNSNIYFDRRLKDAPAAAEGVDDDLPF
jgi:hypothetical protein